MKEAVNGVVKNKNEDWSSVWSSLLLHSEFSEHVQIPIRGLLKHTAPRVSAHVHTRVHSKMRFIMLNVQPCNQVKELKGGKKKG